VPARHHLPTDDAADLFGITATRGLQPTIALLYELAAFTCSLPPKNGKQNTCSVALMHTLNKMQEYPTQQPPKEKREPLRQRTQFSSACLTTKRTVTYPEVETAQCRYMIHTYSPPHAAHRSPAAKEQAKREERSAAKTLLPQAQTQALCCVWNA
jgi:hypothetical protein